MSLKTIENLLFNKLNRRHVYFCVFVLIMIFNDFILIIYFVLDE